jgi:hypothetical protein
VSAIHPPATSGPWLSLSEITLHGSRADIAGGDRTVFKFR